MKKLKKRFLLQEKNFIKIVADTNVLISSLIGKLLKEFYNHFKKNHFILLISDIMLEELFDVLKREKIKKYISVSDREEFLKLLVLRSIKVKPKINIRDCRDLDDNIILECAVSSDAKYIVTGDNDLLDLNPYKGIKIIKPVEFINLLNKLFDD